MDEAALREAYLRKIIYRYRDYINLQEQKNLAELKALAASTQPVSDLKKQLEKPTQEEYAEACFSFASSLKTIHVPLPVSFWLSFDDVLALGAGDAMDKALLLTCLLNAGGVKAFLRIVLLESGVQHALVWFSLVKPPAGSSEDKTQSVWLMDAVHGLCLKAESLDAALVEYAKTHAVKKSLYEFNHEEYREL